MKKRIIWMLVSCLMVLSLLVASCGTKEIEEKEEEEEGEAKVIIKEEEKEKEEVEVVEEEATGPKYGGELTISATGDPIIFDELGSPFHAAAYTLQLTNEELVIGDWARGPAGTGEADFILTVGGFVFSTGCLAESWEIPEVGHIIFHIRQGVHYALNPASEASRLVNGRELTADDVATTLNKYRTTPGSAASYADFVKATVTAPDKWTVDIQIPPQYTEDISVTMDYASICAPEVWEKYGSMRDWRNSVGTGPFILMDYVPSASVILSRNPNYWMKDPVGPGKGNQLPYLSGVKFVIIPDNSTRQAALRTGKIDILHGVDWINAGYLMDSNPDLLYNKSYGTAGMALSMRTDKMELPFSKKDVRRALMMATDFEAIKRDYCGGDAEILTWPIIYQKEYADAYLPLEEAPASVKELYVYNPEKARQLLTEAGYPNGFKTKIVCTFGGSDYLSIIKDMWAKVGVTLEIDPVEAGAFTGMTASRQYGEMIFSGAGLVANLYIMENLRGRIAFGNLSYVNDPKCEEAYAKMCLLSVVNPTEANRVYKELMSYALDQAWAVPYVAAASYNMWWPWIKNFYGVADLGRSNFPKWARFIWIDQELKKSMGY